MTSTIESEVRDEVVALHRFFVEWFTGVSPNDAIETDFLSHFAGFMCMRRDCPSRSRRQAPMIFERGRSGYH